MQCVAVKNVFPHCGMRIFGRAKITVEITKYLIWQILVNIMTIHAQVGGRMEGGEFSRIFTGWKIFPTLFFVNFDEIPNGGGGFSEIFESGETHFSYPVLDPCESMKRQFFVIMTKFFSFHYKLSTFLILSIQMWSYMKTVSVSECTN